jgi:penicillin-binding protein-related factor A (putative recombinase)
VSGFAGRGRPLEHAISRAAKRYYSDHCEIRKQETPTATSVELGVFYSSSAPIDFLGVIEGRACAIEAKQVSKGASLSLHIDADPVDRVRDVDFTEAQQKALGHQYQLGAWTRLVVAFDEHNETFAIDWPPLAAFIANAWRGSLSLEWCRAYGDLVPDGPRLDVKARACRFLEGRPHEDRELALAHILEERSKALVREATKPTPPRPVKLKGPRSWTSTEYREATPEQRYEHGIELIAYASKRQAKQQRRGRR